MLCLSDAKRWEPAIHRFWENLCLRPWSASPSIAWKALGRLDWSTSTNKAKHLANSRIHRYPDSAFKFSISTKLLSSSNSMKEQAFLLAWLTGHCPAAWRSQRGTFLWCTTKILPMVLRPSHSRYRFLAHSLRPEPLALINAWRVRQQAWQR